MDIEVGNKYELRSGIIVEVVKIGLDGAVWVVNGDDNSPVHNMLMWQIDIGSIR